MKNFHFLVLLLILTAFTIGCDDTISGGGDVVADRILAIAEFDGDDETIKVGGVAGAVPPGSEVIVTNLDTQVTESTTGLPDGSFDPEFQGSTNDMFLVEVFDNAELIDTTELSVITLESLVNRNLDQLGSVPSLIKIQGSRAYVLNGFSDNIQVFDINQNPPVEIGTITLPPGSDPVGMDFINEQQALVANLISQTAAVVNLETFECETLYTRQEGVAFDPCNEAINLGTGRFEEPFGVLVVGNTGYITNQNIDANFIPNGNGFITVIDLENDTSFTIQAGGAGSVDMHQAGDEIFIVNAGNVDFAPVTFDPECDPLFTPSVDVLNINSNTIVENIPIPLSQINPTACFPDSIAATPDNQFAYLGLGLAGGLLKIDLVNKQLINGTDDPIVVTDLNDLQRIDSLAIDENGIGFIPLFNTDQIAVINTANDEINPFPAITPFPAGIRAFDPDNDFFDGVQFLALRPGVQGVDFIGPNIYYITTLSDQLGSVNANIILP